MANYGELFQIQGDFENAQKYFEESKEMRVKLFDENHVDVGFSYVLLGSLNVKKDTVKAKEFLEKSIVILKNLFKEEGHKYLALAYFKFAVLEKETGNLHQSEKYFEESLKMRRNLFGKNNLNVASSYSFLGVLNYNNGNFLKAQNCHKKCLKIFLKISKDKFTSNLGRCYRNVGMAQFAMKNWAEAKKCFLK